MILFVDPDPAVVERVHDTGADGIEIYTGGYAAGFRAGAADARLQACAATAARAAELGLVVNIGHDLNLDNLPPLVAALPGVAEASIGHELTADALVMGFAAAVRAYRAALGAGCCGLNAMMANTPQRGLLRYDINPRARAAKQRWRRPACRPITVPAAMRDACRDEVCDTGAAAGRNRRL